jgi:flavin reductase (DIM6/NTAB) family NADH-FMN oxidoreductase RutF
MFIVTTLSAEGERDGCLIGFATQCSIHPPRFVACISKKNRTYEAAKAADTIVVHFLGQAQEELAALFGEETGDEVDKFELCDWEDGPDGVPVLTGAAGWFAGHVLDRFDLGDHVGFWLEPFKVSDTGEPVDLGFQAVKGVDPGHPA